MIDAARLAYAHARIRARKSRWLNRDGLRLLAASDTPAALVADWRDFDDRFDDPSLLLALVYRRLIGHYAAAIRACPPAASALGALVCLHEIENLKLVWRAVLRGRSADAWMRLWRPLGPLQAIDSDQVRTLGSLPALQAALARSPYGSLAAEVIRAHGDDLPASEIALDRWGSRQVWLAAAALPRREAAARHLLLLVVAERDEAIVARTVRLSEAIEAADALRVASLPRRLRPVDPARERRIACARAFRGQPYSLAPIVAFALGCEDEARALLSVAESRAKRFR